MSEENNVEVSTENTIDWEARAMKAEAKIVDMKTNPKETPEVKTEAVKPVKIETNNFMTREDFERERFLETNSELAEHKDKLKEYSAKGISLEQAKMLILAEDKTIEARQTTQKANFTAGNPDFTTSTYSTEDLGNLSQGEYNQVMKLKEQGKVTIT